MAGSHLVETVFNIPGMGRLLVQGVLDKDFIMVQAGVLILGIMICTANLIVDITLRHTGSQNTLLTGQE